VGEPGKDLSVPGDTKCCTCFQWIPTEDYHLHMTWHASLPKPQPVPAPGLYPPLGGDTFNSVANSVGIHAGMPVEDAINQLCGMLQVLQADKYNLQNEINKLQAVIGTEGCFRFLRDWGQP
jgi:hypothetical protein